MSAGTPYVLVPSASALSACLEDTFAAGVNIVMRPPDDDSRVVHAEARIGDALLSLSIPGRTDSNV